MPAWRATTTMGTVDMPTASAPTVRRKRSFGGGFQSWASHVGMDAFLQGEVVGNSRFLRQLPQAQILTYQSYP
ncbi:MAG: hypothetical protein R3D55_00750 [Chloroflexota bacterium]